MWSLYNAHVIIQVIWVPFLGTLGLVTLGSTSPKIAELFTPNCLRWWRLSLGLFVSATTQQSGYRGRCILVDRPRPEPDQRPLLS